MLPFVMRKVLDLRKGEKGPYGKEGLTIYKDLMGMTLEKERRRNRSQSAAAWLEPLTDPKNNVGKNDWDSTAKGISLDCKDAMRKFFKKRQLLFDREQVLGFEGEQWGFTRFLFAATTRAILNHEQNQETQNEKKETAEKKLQNFTTEREKEAGEINTSLSKIVDEFQSWENKRTQETKASEPVKISGAIIGNWDEIWERFKRNGSSGIEERLKIIKDVQREAPEEFGDFDFFSWIASRKNLWPWVRTITKYNAIKREVEQYEKRVEFSYPLPENRPQWMEFSAYSPGHMFDILSIEPGTIRLAAFVPKEDVPKLKELGIIETTRRKRSENSSVPTFDDGFLKESIQWKHFEVNPDGSPYGNLPIFKNSKLLDLKQFSHEKVLFPLQLDTRLRPFSFATSGGRGRNLRQVRTEGKGRRMKLSSSDGDGAPKWCLDYDPRLLSPAQRRHSPPAESDWIPLFFQMVRLQFNELNKRPKAATLHISCQLNPPIPERKKIKFESEPEDATVSEEKPKKSKKPKKRKIPEGITTLTVDLGQRFTACLSVIKHENGKLPPKPRAVKFLKMRGLELPSLKQHDSTLARKRKLTAQVLRDKLVLTRPALENLAKKTNIPFDQINQKLKEYKGNIQLLAEELKIDGQLIKDLGLLRPTRMAKGEDFALELKEHVQNMKDDRAKKASHEIVRFAVEKGVDTILFERLKGYRPDEEFTHSTNARLRNWNRRELVEWTKNIAQFYGIQVYDYLYPAYTSRFCSSCGSVGARFSEIEINQALFDFPTNPNDEKFEKQKKLIEKMQKTLQEKGITAEIIKEKAGRRRGKILGLLPGYRQVIRGGKLFCCSECMRIVNADFNAALNLQKVLYEPNWAEERFRPYEAQPFGKNKECREKRRQFFLKIDNDIQKILNKKFNQEAVYPSRLWPELQT